MDRYANLRLNRIPAKYKPPEGYGCPMTVARRGVLSLAGSAKAPAVTLRMRLVDDGYLHRGEPGFCPDAAPEMFRDVVVPLGAPLSWLHGAIC